MRSRSGGVAARKLKGNLLAAVLLLTTLPSSVKLSQAAVEHLCFLIAHLMNAPDASEVSCVVFLVALTLQHSQTAVHCARLIILAAGRGGASGVLQYCIGHLLPALVEYTARAAAIDPVTPAVVSSVQDVLRTYVALLGLVPVQSRASIVSSPHH